MRIFVMEVVEEKVRVVSQRSTATDLGCNIRKYVRKYSVPVLQDAWRKLVRLFAVDKMVTWTI